MSAVFSQAVMFSILGLSVNEYTFCCVYVDIKKSMQNASLDLGRPKGVDQTVD